MGSNVYAQRGAGSNFQRSTSLGGTFVKSGARFGYDRLSVAHLRGDAELASALGRDEVGLEEQVDRVAVADAGGQQVAARSLGHHAEPDERRTQARAARRL
jgi:hypothetical protein